LNCYVLSFKDFESSADWEDESRTFVGTVCPLDPTSETHVAHHATNGNLRVTSPFKKRHLMIWTMNSECLVHEDLIRALRKEAFSGFELRDATVRFRDGSVESELYKELIVTGWGGRARPESGIRLLRQCPRCGTRWYTDRTRPEFVFNEAEWDRSDFFRIWPLPPTYTMVTDRLASWLQENKISLFSCETLKLVDPLITAATKNSYTPGPLDDYYPRERALQLAPDLVGPYIPGPSRERGAWPPSN